MKASKWLLVLFTLVGLSVSGCASKKYKYDPSETDQTAACIGNTENVAEYPIPLHSQSGDVKIESLGIADVSPNEHEPKQHVLQLRMTLVNHQKVGAWSLRTKDQAVVFENQSELRPAWAQYSNQAIAELNIKPAQTQVVDLYYALPKAYEKPDQVPAFSFVWTLLTPGGTESEKTKFERSEVPHKVASGSGYYPGFGFGFGWGPIWGYPRWR